MNIIDAWKSAKEGQRLTRPVHGVIKLRSKPTATSLYKSSSITKLLDILQSEEILADDWEVVKEKKSKTYDMLHDAKLSYSNDVILARSVVIPAGSKVTIELEE